MKLPEPTISRPTLPAEFGVSTSRAGLLSWEWAMERLASSRNYWVATTMPDGSPHVVPAWGLWLDDGFHFGAAPRSQWGRNLQRDQRAAVHLESADEVVIVKGDARPHLIDARIADASKEKYGHRPEPSDEPLEGVYRLAPRVVFAWIVSDMVHTPTRFLFDPA